MTILLRRVLIGAVVLLGAASFRSAPSPSFQQQLAAGRLTLTAPSGWTETPVIANNVLRYDYALRYPGRRLEVRYAAEPLALLLADYALGKKDKTHLQVNPNELRGQFFIGTMLNVRGLKMEDEAFDATYRVEEAKPLNVFPDKALKTEFGADWGALAPLTPGPEFGQAYKHCVLIGLHKTDAADAYVYFLYDDQKDFVEVVMKDPAKAAFHSLRFK
jgi:hypothetical protein